jgi:hypothetical protein
MMAETPLEKLGNAIEDFLRSTGQLDDGRFMTGWVIGTSTARLQTDDHDALPLVSGQTYAFGPETSVTHMAGLAKFLEVAAERAMWSELGDADDD